MEMRSLMGYWKRNLKNYLNRRPTHHGTPKTHHPANLIINTNIAITGLVNNGKLDDARFLFDQMPQRTVISWNIMISGYSKWGKYDESLALLSTMHCTDVKPIETTLSTVLSSCAHARSFREGKQIHSLVLKSNFECFELVGCALLYFYAKSSRIGDAKRVFDELHDWNELLWSVMLVGYAQCGLMDDAYDVFVKMPKKDIVSCTTLISGYAKSNDCCGKALELFQWMRESDEVVPNEFTLDVIIRVCGRLGALIEGMVVHGILMKCGFEFDPSIGGALVQFYCDCEAIDDAKIVHAGLINPCLNASNLLIEGFLSMGRIDDAELIFNRLHEKDSVSYNLMIKGYEMNGRVEDSKSLFEKMPHKTLTSLNTMISVYSRNGEIDKALVLFEEAKWERNPVTWNSMISGYIHNDYHEEAMRLYVTMRRTIMDYTRSTFSIILHACSCIGSLQQGQMIHANLAKTPFESNVYVGTSLIHMYCKCGNIFDAQRSFSSISSPNVAAWTALINGYAHHGLCSETILLFERMLEGKVAPNGATFVGILAACSRAGLVDEGMRIFHLMDKKYGVTPTLEHYACVVDLLGRSGYLIEAEDFIKAMPIEADGVVWSALLSACWFWMNMEVGERVAEQMFNLEPKPTSAYVILSNIYAILGKWREKINVRNRLRDLEVKKDPGCSWIEVNSRQHVFSVDNRTHLDCSVIYATLENLTSNLTSFVPFNCSPLSFADEDFSNALYHY